MHIRTRSRPGFALAVAIFAIVVIGALVAGIFYASTQQYRIGRSQVLQTRALGIAEYGLNRTLVPEGQAANGWWKTQKWNTMALGTVDSSLSYTAPNGAVTRVRVTRVGDPNTAVFLIASEGRAGSLITAQARRRMGMLVVLQPLQLNMLGALTTRGNTKVGGSSFIDGNDTTTYAGWDCPTGSSPMPGIASPDAALIETSGCADGSCVTGVPRISQNPAAGDTATYFDYGNGMTWSTLTAMATKSGYAGTLTGLGPVAAGGICVTGAWQNWGDPNRNPVTPGPCEGYFPIIYAPGDLHISGGVGQGVLLVGGNLRVDGGFQFYGPVIVRGDLDTQGTGGHFNGGVMAANVNLLQNTFLGNAVVTYSKCIVAKALTAVAAPQPMAGRPWAELY
jgi:hypothetical protein